MKCPRCMTPIGPDDRVCPGCSALLVLERKPTRPDEEKGWTLRHLASIMGRAGCLVAMAQAIIVLIGSAALFGQAIAFLNGSDRTPDLAPVGALVTVASSVDLIGLGLLAVALVVLGAGTMFLRRRDPFTEEEVMIPPTTAALPMASGLFVILWLLVTAVWRVVYPVQIGTSAAEMLAEFASTGSSRAPGVLGLMMALWIVSAIALLAAAVCLRLFVRRLPSKVYSPRPMKPSSWLDYAFFNLVIVIGAAVFPIGWVAYDTVGGPAQIAFLTFLATKITVIPLLGAFAYWSLLTRFDAFGKLALFVPVLKAIPPEAAAAEADVARTTVAGPMAPVPPPGDDEMAGIGRVR